MSIKVGERVNERDPYAGPRIGTVTAVAMSEDIQYRPIAMCRVQWDTGDHAWYAEQNLVVRT